MKSLSTLIFALALCGCLGDTHVTRTSTSREPARSQTISGVRQIEGPPSRPGRFRADRVYLITRLATEDQSIGQWRAQGATIKEAGNRIEFVELTSGRTIEFDSPHQTSLTPSRIDVQETDFRAAPPAPSQEGGNARSLDRGPALP